MTQEELDSVVLKMRDDASLQESLRGASSLEEVLTIVNESGFNVSKADLMKRHARQTLELSDKELEDVCCSYWSQYSQSCV
jgi:predicted ribosomally synthesized peptide with nif11-like leader